MPKLVAILVYFVCLIPVTIVTVIVLGNVSNFIVVPLEYIAPLAPAYLAYQLARERHVR